MVELAASSASPPADVQPPQMQSEQRASQPSVAQLCHTDALHCIFAFLDLKELLPAAFVSRLARCGLQGALARRPRALGCE